MTIVLDVSFNDDQSPSNSDSQQNSPINEISRKKDRQNARVIKVAKVKNKVSDIDADSSPSSPRRVGFIANEILWKAIIIFHCDFLSFYRCSVHAENNNGWAEIVLHKISISFNCGAESIFLELSLVFYCDEITMQIRCDLSLRWSEKLCQCERCNFYLRSGNLPRFI